jgi:LysM repeat protein
MNRIFIILALFTASLSLSAQTYQEQLKAIHSNVVEHKDGMSYYVHIVKKGQTLYMISKAYGIEVNDIIAGNPVVKEGLKADQKLYIPLSTVPHPATDNPHPPNVNQQLSMVKPHPPIINQQPQTGKPRPSTSKPDSMASVRISLPCGCDTSARHKTYKLVLMLPLYLEEVEAMNPETATDSAIENWNSLKYLPFYEGLIIAVDSLRKQGLHLVLYVYDVGKDTLKTQHLLKKAEVKSADLMIGLLFNKNFQIVAKFARENHIPIINPLSERSEISRDNEMVFKTNPSPNSLLESLGSYMQKNMYRGQILIVRNGQFKDKEIAEKMKKECLERNLNVVLAEGQDIALGKLSKSKENVIVAFADNNAYALDLMRRFYELRNDYNISLIGLPDWEQIEGLETDFLNGLNTHLVSPSFVDYSNAGVKKLVLLYQQRYKSDPEPLAFQGFDVGYYFISALMNFGKAFPKCIQDFRLKTSQTNFEFVRLNNSANNGFENHYWTVYKYEGFKLVKVN